MPNSSISKTIFDNLGWSFTGAPHSSPESLSSEVRSYQTEVFGEDTWRPDEVVLDWPKILIQFMHWEGDEQVFPVIELSSSNGKSFTAEDLLFQLHNAVVGKLNLIDHHFLEGLELNSHPIADTPPLYILLQGS